MQIKVSKFDLSLISADKALGLISKTKDHRLLVAASMNVLPRGSGNFDYDPSLGKFSDFFQTLPDLC